MTDPHSSGDPRGGEAATPTAAAPPFISLQDMVAGHSISEAGAELLRGIGSTGASFLVYALPRNAGKSTLTRAIVAEAPASLPRLEFYGTEEERASLSATGGSGYLQVAEIGHAGRPGYLTGEEVGRLFQLLGHGYSLASSLHADSVDEVFDVLGRNSIPSEVAASVDYFIKVRALGDPDDPSTQRVVEEVHEITRSTTGEPLSALLYRRHE